VLYIVVTSSAIQQVGLGRIAGERMERAGSIGEGPSNTRIPLSGSLILAEEKLTAIKLLLPCEVSLKITVGKAINDPVIVFFRQF